MNPYNYQNISSKLQHFNMPNRQKIKKSAPKLQQTTRSSYNFLVNPSNLQQLIATTSQSVTEAPTEKTKISSKIDLMVQ